MLVLASTSDKVQIVTAQGVSSILVHASWLDDNAGSITPGNTNTSITSATTTTVVASPAASTYRSIKALTIYNSSASSCGITVKLANGSSTSQLFVYTLLAGETIQYFDTTGFEVLDITGARKMTAPTGKLITRNVIAAQGSTTLTFNYQVSQQTNTVRIRMMGGGGGGGACTTNANMNFGSGGAAGGYTEVYTPVTPGAYYAVTVGGGGTGGSGAGGTGGTTTWTGNATNTTIQWGANGGLGGAIQSAANASFVYTGGGLATAANSANSPSLAIGATRGGISWRNNGTSGNSGAGGDGLLDLGYGQAIVAAGVATAGATPGTGSNFGAGGTGAGGNSAANGGNGCPGFLIVEEYT